MFRSFIVAAVLGLTTLFSCQQASTEGDATTTQAQTSVTADTVQTQRRPAPAFHKIPTELAKTRVYICTDSSADTFHKKHDCEVLIQCKAMFRGAKHRMNSGSARAQCSRNRHGKSLLLLLPRPKNLLLQKNRQKENQAPQPAIKLWLLKMAIPLTSYATAKL